MLSSQIQTDYLSIYNLPVGSERSIGSVRPADVQPPEYAECDGLVPGGEEAVPGEAQQPNPVLAAVQQVHCVQYSTVQYSRSTV